MADFFAPYPFRVSVPFAPLDEINQFNAMVNWCKSSFGDPGSAGGERWIVMPNQFIAFAHRDDAAQFEFMWLRAATRR